MANLLKKPATSTELPIVYAPIKQTTKSRKRLSLVKAPLKKPTKSRSGDKEWKCWLGSSGRTASVY